MANVKISELPVATSVDVVDSVPLVQGGTTKQATQAALLTTTGNVTAAKLVPTGGTATGNGMYLPATNTLAWSTNGAEGMRLDASGNVGIGTSSPGEQLSVVSGTSKCISSTSVVPGSPATIDDQEFSTFSATAAVSGLTFSGVDPRLLTATVTPTNEIVWRAANIGLLSTGYLTLSTNSTERMRLDASGNLGIGTSSPTTKLDVDGSAVFGSAIFTGKNVSTGDVAIELGGQRSGNGNAYLDLHATSSTDFEARFGRTSGVNGIAQIFNTGTGEMQITQFGAAPIVFSTSATECARITSGGDLLVGTTSTGGGYTTNARVTVEARTNEGAQILINDSGATQWVQWIWNKGTSGNNSFVEFATEGTYTARGSIAYNRAGGLVAYNTTSDYRAKDILGPVADPGATIDALKVYEGRMKGATQSRPMLVAHEAQEHAPYAVSGVKDEVNEDGTPKYQQMDVSALVPLLIAEIQSLRARVAALEA